MTSTSVIGWAGYGYVAHALEALAMQRMEGVSFAATTRETMQERECPLPRTLTHLLVSIPPNTLEADDAGDVFLRQYPDFYRSYPRLRWVGFLSSTGVYGDHQGAWVDEHSPLLPLFQKDRCRALAESQWQHRYDAQAVPVHIFRLGAIYGPGRNPLVQCQAGTAQRIMKPGHYFSRIHVADIAAMLLQSMRMPTPGEIYNLVDDVPSPQAEMVAYAASLLRLPPPPLVGWEEGRLSEGMREFYQSSRRVKNDKIKTALGLTLQYPSYIEGLDALFSGNEAVNSLC